MTAVCSPPQESCTGWSFFNQKILGILSAKLLFPNVKMAPVSDDESKSETEIIHSFLRGEIGYIIFVPSRTEISR